MSRDIEILVLVDEDFPDEDFPHYASKEAAGADLRAHLTEPLILPPRRSVLVPTGLKFEIPPGFEMQIRPRSGLALHHHVTVLNTPGTIDADYRGEIKVLLINHGEQEFIIQPKMRIAQAVFAPVLQARFMRADALSESCRSSGGFGHTGVN